MSWLRHMAAPMGVWTPEFVFPYLWWDAADTSTLTGNPVSAWVDKSANKFIATQSNAAKRPSRATLNGQGVLLFDGVDDTLLHSASYGTSATLFATVTRAAGGSNYQIIFAATGPSTKFVATMHSKISDSEQWGTYQDQWRSGGAMVPNTLTMLSLEASEPGGFTAYTNGTQTASVSTLNRYADTADRRAIGADGPTYNGGYLSGYIGDIIVVPGVSTTTRQKVEGWLAHRRGLAGLLPTNHPYLVAPP